MLLNLLEVVDCYIVDQIVSDEYLLDLSFAGCQLIISISSAHIGNVVESEP